MMLIWLLAALFIAALTACSKSTDAGIPTASDSQAASSGEANSAQAEPTPNSEDPEDAALTYSQCMRENGVPNFPDADAEGRIRISPPGSIDPDSAEFQGASEACRHLAPEGWGETNTGPGDAEALLEFTRCMRENGVPDFPDPDPSTGVRNIFGRDSRLDPNDPKVKAALELCQAILEDSQKPALGG
jgi:hypothetical protein